MKLVTTSPTASLAVTRPGAGSGRWSSFHWPVLATICSRASRASSARSRTTKISVPQKAIWMAIVIAPEMPAPIASP